MENKFFGVVLLLVSLALLVVAIRGLSRPASDERGKTDRLRSWEMFWSAIAGFLGGAYLVVH